ncbi:amidohydrolase family protein [Peribacillus kribbensis]|uniref:amidohydrolase family protein n=1 Tax=Peribacillus kribbensis TaxID=356658 RepID=UPI0003FB5E3D|nr:amidohydrolase family protein [Peribacillus kribbensis]
MRVDAHQHFWRLDRGDYGWLTPEFGMLYQDFLPDQIRPHLLKHDIQRTILVQAAPTIAETEYLLSLYARYDFIAGVVGWLDLEAGEFKKEFERLLDDQGFVGIRPMLQDLEDDQWILRPDVLKSIEILAERDFPIDLLIKPRHLPHIRTLMREFPELRAVINHIAKPDISSGLDKEWKEGIEELAGYPHIMCKLSGIITEAAQPYSVSQIRPFVHHVVEAFGKDRVMFGSDWPVCLLAGSYDDVYGALRNTLPDSIDLQKLFGENAARFYQLKTKGGCT